MNAEKLLEYLRDESHLYSLNYHEFKSLVMQYPYCQNLRVLLVKKAQIDGQKDLERDQQLAAAYVTDRRFLNKKMKELETQLQQNNLKMQVSEHIILTEDKMELSALSDLEKMITDRHITEVFAVPSLLEMSADLTGETNEMFNFSGKIPENKTEESVETELEPTFELPNMNGFENPIQSYLASFQPVVITVLEEKTTEKSDIEPAVSTEILTEISTKNETESVMETAPAIEIVAENAVTEIENMLSENSLENIADDVAEDVIQNLENDDLNEILDSLAVENLLTEAQVAAIEATDVKLSDTSLPSDVQMGNYDALFDDIFGENVVQNAVENTILTEKMEEIESIAPPPVSDPILPNFEEKVADNWDLNDLSLLGLTKLDSDEEIAALQIAEIERLKNLSEEDKIIIEAEENIIKNINFANFFDEAYDEDDAPEVDEFGYEMPSFSPQNAVESAATDKKENNVVEWEFSPLADADTDSDSDSEYFDDDEDDEDDDFETEIIEKPVSSFGVWLQDDLDEKEKKQLKNTAENDLDAPQKSTAMERLEALLRENYISEQQKTSEEATIEDVIAEASTSIFEQSVQEKTDLDVKKKESMRRISSFQLDSIFEASEEEDMGFIGATPPPPVRTEKKAETLENFDKTDKKKKKKEAMHPLAERSITPDNELLSETLANILAWQGQKEEAIRMYRNLSLKFPEKSAYFAAKIELLEK